MHVAGQAECACCALAWRSRGRSHARMARAARQTIEVTHRVRAWRNRLGLTLDQLGDLIGMTGQNLGKIERGLVPLGEEHHGPLARAFGISVPDLFRDPDSGTGAADAPPGRPTVPLVGYVGAGAAAHYYAEGQGPHDYVEAPDNASESTVAAEIRGDSLGALFNEWLVFYDEIRDPVTPDLYGKLCVVGLPDGRILVKQIKKAADGRFHLISNTEGPMLDQDVAWAARVKDMRPR